MRDATSFAANCLEVSPSGRRIDGDEDCLYLNVWGSTDTESASARPVLVYVHGGTFAQGSVATYDGEELASRTGAIIVTLNHRLGALGEFALGNGGEANFALLDVTAALAWVKTNVAEFGGDPGRVALMGEGAGATLALAAWASPETVDLFSRVILDGATLTLRLRGDVAMASGAVADKTACRRDADVLSCLRRQPANDVATAIAPVDAAGFLWGPVAGAPSLPAAPEALLRAGRLRHVPLILGAGENDLSTWEWVRHAEPGPDDEIAYVRVARARLKRHLAEAEVDTIMKLYPYASFSSGQQALVALETDRDVTCPTRRFARALSSAQQDPVWRFVWSHSDASGLDRQYGAGRGTEVKYFFRSAMPQGFSETDGERALGATIVGAIARFVATGDPNETGDTATWPRYEPGTDPYLAVDTKSEARHGMHAAACDVWDAITAAHADR